MTKDATDHLRAVLDAIENTLVPPKVWNAHRDARAYLATIDATPTYDALANLNVQPGDMVENPKGWRAKIGCIHGSIYHNNKGSFMSNATYLETDNGWRIVSRATPAWSIFTNNKMTRDLSPDQLAALKAWEGSWIFNSTEGTWTVMNDPGWGSYAIYRAVPAPTQEQPAPPDTRKPRPSRKAIEALLRAIKDKTGDGRLISLINTALTPVPRKPKGEK